MNHPSENLLVRLMTFLGFVGHDHDYGYRDFARFWRVFFVQLRAMIIIWVAMVFLFSLVLVLVRIGQSPVMIVVCLLVAVVIALAFVRWPVSTSKVRILEQGGQVNSPIPINTAAPYGVRPFDEAVRDSTREVLNGGKFAQGCIERISKPEDLIVAHEVTIQFVSVADKLIITLQDVYVNTALMANLAAQLDALRKAAVNGVVSISDSRRIASLIQSVTETVRNLLDSENRNRGAASK